MLKLGKDRTSISLSDEVFLWILVGEKREIETFLKKSCKHEVSETALHSSSNAQQADNLSCFGINLFADMCPRSVILPTCYPLCQI